MRGSPLPSPWAALFVVALSLMEIGAAAPASAQDSPIRSIAKSAGLVMDPPPAADFVRASRPASDPEPIPVFRAPDEPPSKVKTRAELKAMDANLESAGKKHDAIRAAFPPAAKAVAEAEAARKAKSKIRTPPAAASPNK